MDISLGTWQIAPSDGFWTDQDKTTSEAMVSSAVRLGIRHFDTAQSYGKGQSEQVLSKVLSRYPDESFLVDTKIMPSSKKVSDIIKVSQSRLKGLPIDCLYLHWPKSGFDNRSFLEEMSALKKEGAVQKIGICNMPLSDLSALLESGLRIDRYQRPVSLLWTRELAETKTLCRDFGIELVAYSPMGMGLLSGKYKDSNDLCDARAKCFCFDVRCHRQYLNLLSAISDVAQRCNMTMSEVALAWTAGQSPDLLLLGARNAEQLKSDFMAIGRSLCESDMEHLSEASFELEKASMGVCDNIFSYNW